MRMNRASHQQHAVPEKQPAEAVIEFVTDDTAKPGDVIPALARLLLSLVTKADGVGAEGGVQAKDAESQPDVPVAAPQERKQVQIKDGRGRSPRSDQLLRSENRRV
jgi:hypothetical protein